MNKILRIISVLSLLLLMAANCNPDPEPEPVPEPTASITFSIPAGGLVTQTTDGNASAEFTSANGSATVSFTTTVAWSASSSATWCVVSPASGPTGSGQVTLTIAKNETYDDRTATVTITAGTAKRTVAVKQLAAGGMQVSPPSIDVPYGGGEYEIEVKKNVDYTVAVSESAKSWISVKGTKALTTDKVRIVVSPNDGAAAREGMLTFKSSAGEATVKVTQAYDDSFYISPTQVELSADGGTFEVTVLTHKSYHISSKPEWVTEKSLENNVYTFEVGKNTDTADRNGVIVICDDTGTCLPVTVHQAGDYEMIDWSRAFFHRSLVFKFTADWCGYCPHMSTSLKKAHEALPDKFVSVDIHGNSSSYQFDKYDAWDNLFNVTGYPSSYMDMRREIANYSRPEDYLYFLNRYLQEQEENYPVSSTVALRSSLSGDKLKVDVTYYFKDAGDYKVAVYLTESGIIGYQADHIDGDRNNYCHNDVVRIALTDVLGDALPVYSVNTRVKRSYSVTIPSKYNKETLKLLVFVMRAFGSQERLGGYGDYYVDNCVYGKVGVTLTPAIVTENDGRNETVIDGNPVIW